jgi:hypothetical protein
VTSSSLAAAHNYHHRSVVFAEAGTGLPLYYLVLLVVQVLLILLESSSLLFLDPPGLAIACTIDIIIDLLSTTGMSPKVIIVLLQLLGRVKICASSSHHSHTTKVHVY